MVRTCTGFPAAERRQQHARRQGKARRLTQVPWAESRRPLAQPAALPPRMGPKRPIIAQEEEEGLFRANAVNEEDPERDRATQV